MNRFRRAGTSEGRSGVRETLRALNGALHCGLGRLECSDGPA